VRSRRRKPLMHGWAAATIALTAGLPAADGGPHSALTALFFLPLAFVALSFRLRAVLMIGAAEVLAFVGMGLAEGSASRPYLAFYATCLAITAVICGWAARHNERREEALTRVSRADPLTGCLNRRGFEERLDAELAAATRSGRAFGLVLLDLDDFKAVNDSRGHAAGDEFLRWTVERAASVLRPMDSLGRLGGDEFAVLVPDAGAAGAGEVAARIAEAVRERVSLSTGIAAFPGSGSDRDCLFRAADEDLYNAKHGRAGRRRFTRAGAPSPA
jgi:diguanylate cyclase (GGDEF)-like protein